MSVDPEEPNELIVVFETCMLFAERVDEENGCNGPILFASNYCRSGAMEKLVANIATGNRGEAERTQQKAEALVPARGGIDSPLIEGRAKRLTHFALDHDADRASR
jgi:hypothetical protein